MGCGMEWSGCNCSIFSILMRPKTTKLGFGSNFAENIKIVQKPKFSYGFSLFSGIWRTSKSMKNHKKSTLECFGTPENHPGWEGLAGLARSVALGKENIGQRPIPTLIKLATIIRAQATGKTHPYMWGNPLPPALIRPRP